MSNSPIRCGDHVRHGPSGETWVVAFADYERNELAWCGWPEGLSTLSNYTLIKAATDEESRKLAREIVSSGPNGLRGRGVRRCHPELLEGSPMRKRDTLPVLLGLVRAGSGPDRELDARIEAAMRWEEGAQIGMKPEHRGVWWPRADGTVSDPHIAYPARPFTGSLDAAVALVERMLPGWWWKCGTCCVSDDACVAPDFNSKIHGKRLKKELRYPITVGSEFDAGFDVDRRPPGNVPRALLESLIRALIACEARRAGGVDA